MISRGAVAQEGPLPCAAARRTLPAFETGERKLRTVLDALDAARIQLDPALLLNVNEPSDLRGIVAPEDHERGGIHD